MKANFPWSDDPGHRHLLGSEAGMTLSRFVPAPENRSALAAVQRVAGCLASRRGLRRTNPLFLHGPPGTGKTHLVHALVKDVTRRCPDLNAVILAAGDLKGDRPEAGTPTLLETARDGDLVIVEDVHHLPERSAEALAQFLDAVVARQQQVVLTATVGPSRLGHLSARLTGRLAAGLVVGMEPLAVAGRLALLEDKAQCRQLAVCREVLAWLAEHLTGGGRQLEGALAQLEVLARLRREPLDVEAVATHFRDQVEALRPTVERIARQVSGHFQLDSRQLRSSQRFHKVLLPRQISMYLARQLTDLSLEQIGSYFGGRDHSTVLHACRKVEQALVEDAVLSGTVRQLRADLA